MRLFLGRPCVGSMTATLPRILPNYTHHFITLLSSPLFSSNFLTKQGSSSKTTQMALQAPTISIKPSNSPLAPTPNAGLRPPSDRFALKSSFFSPSLHLLLPSPHQRLPTNTASPAPKFSMRVASKQAYICRDCGYIYNERTPFEKVSDSYFCPVCGAPKRRFKPYQPAVTKNANDTDVRKARKEQIKRDEAVGKALPIAIVVGIAVLAGLYFYLNSTISG
ncbi:rub [Gossypium arboreum]|uniref:Rub n=2 Tax=Gossypium arboreum TaxID=29729 RepID=A0A0B0MXG1_GOSAR|nr:rub [Gossypium arboreum]